MSKNNSQLAFYRLQIVLVVTLTCKVQEKIISTSIIDFFISRNEPTLKNTLTVSTVKLKKIYDEGRK